jgi:hypothetical protein
MFIFVCFFLFLFFYNECSKFQGCYEYATSQILKRHIVVQIKKIMEFNLIGRCKHQWRNYVKIAYLRYKYIMMSTYIKVAKVVS